MNSSTPTLFKWSIVCRLCTRSTKMKRACAKQTIGKTDACAIGCNSAELKLIMSCRKRVFKRSHFHCFDKYYKFKIIFWLKSAETAFLSDMEMQCTSLVFLIGKFSHFMSGQRCKTAYTATALLRFSVYLLRLACCGFNSTLNTITTHSMCVCERVFMLAIFVLVVNRYLNSYRPRKSKRIRYGMSWRFVYERKCDCMENPYISVLPLCFSQ